MEAASVLPTANGEDLFSPLFADCAGFINVRAIRSGLPPRSEFYPADRLQWVPGVIEKYCDRDLYFAVATRERGNGKKEGIVNIPALWADVDFKNTSQEKADRLISELPVQPSATIESGGGYHLYWLLKEPAGAEDICMIENINRRLAAFLEADFGVCDASHILRLPGTVNYKYDPARPVTVKDNSGARYNLQDFDIFPEVPGRLAELALGKPKPAPAGGGVAGPSSRYGEKALLDETVKFSRASEGCRNEALNKSAFALGQLIAGGELDRGQAEAALHGVAISKGLTGIETRATIKSGIEAGMREPRTAPQSMDKSRTPAENSYDANLVQQPDSLVDPLVFPDIMAGAAGNFSRLLSASLEPPEQFFFMTYLACLGNLVAGSLSLNSEIQTEPRIYLLLLGESADDRKSTALSKTTSFFRGATNFPVCHGVGSAEGLQKILAENSRLLLSFDEFRAFTSKCKIQSSVLMPAVTTLFESRYYENHTAKKSIVIEDALLSLVAASTTDTYEQIFDESFLAIGFPNRIFLCPGKGARKFSLPVRIPENKWQALRQDLADILAHSRELSTVDITYDARKIYHEWYMNLPQSVHAKRLETYAMRLMPLLAVNELKEAVDEDIITKVISLMDWQYRVRCRFDPIDADNVMARIEEKIRRALQTGAKTRRELSRAVHSNRIGTWFFDTALSNLQRAAQIVTEDKGRSYKMTDTETVTTGVTTAL